MNGHLKHLIIGLAAIGTTLSSHAGNITMNWNAFDVTGVALPNGTPVPSGNLIQIGMFSAAPTNGSPSLAGFNVFATGLVGEGGAGNGRWMKSSIADEAGFAGNRAYIVVFNAPTANAATALAILSTTLTTWTFPHSNDVQPFRNIDIESLISAGTAGTPFNTWSASAQPVYQAGYFYSAADQKTYIKLAFIPEPTTFVLVGFGFLAMICFAGNRHGHGNR
jgi:hypothetical protein